MKTLSQNNIYKLSLKDELHRDDLFMIYAPLSGNIMLASDAECELIENALLNNSKESTPVVKNIIDSLTYIDEQSFSNGKVNNVDEFLLMYILPNYICNFSCSYCFSAKGRSNKVIDKDKLKTALDYFIDSKRVQSKELAITYLGGGEPILSWDILKFGIEYGYSLAEKNGFRLYTTIVTNGSRITKEMVDLFSKYGIGVRVSFEIIEEIQNKQRGQYINVCRGIDLLSKGTIPPMIRSMITPDNVELMPAMIKQLHNRFPKIKSVLFDPITSAETFNDIYITKSFYDKYYENFFEARKLASKYGIELGCAPLRNLNMIVERYCTGEFCLTPEGTITLCHQISSPLENNYTNYIYARINDEKLLNIDNDKFKNLVSQHTIYTNPKCKNCFIKWNCGGGCMMRNNQYRSEILDIVCDSTRRFSKKLLFERLKEQYEESEKISLHDYIKQNYQ